MISRLGLISGVIGLAAIGLLFHAVFAQAPVTQTFGETYMAMALAIISLIGNVYNGYLAQKAKLTGQAPNETDMKIAALLASVTEKIQTQEQKGAQLIDFLYNNAVPKQAQEIVEGSLPLIKVQKVTQDVKDADAKVTQAKNLLGSIQEGIVDKK